MIHGYENNKNKVTGLSGHYSMWKFFVMFTLTQYTVFIKFQVYHMLGLHRISLVILADKYTTYQHIYKFPPRFNKFQSKENFMHNI